VTNGPRPSGRSEQQQIDEALDWFAENPTGGGAPPQPFREIVPGVWSQDIQYGTGNSLTIETEAGLVQVDTGIERDHGAGMIAAVREVSDQPLHAIVYSHGHTAYNHGVEAWLEHAESRGEPLPRIVAHRNLPRRYARYRETIRWQELTAEWQFGFPPGTITDKAMFEVLVDPDETYIDDLTLVSGGRRVELLHCHAETDDGTAVWLPDDGLLYGGNATIGSFPNIGSPLRSPRDPRAWADTLDRYVALDAEILVREFGPEIHGAAVVQDMLTSVRDALRWLRSETLERLNAGMVIEDVVHDIGFPTEWADSPWMPQTYGCPEYVIRDVWRVEAGWWDRNITSVHPAPAAKTAAAIAAAITDHDAVLGAAEAHVAAGEFQLALHVIDLLALSPGDEPTVVRARELKGRVAAALAEDPPSYMSGNYYRAVAAGFPAR
jgi:alkyl sulfatase BDS1-like metallo-beta-lactamase superfamily hydrolase